MKKAILLATTVLVSTSVLAGGGLFGGGGSKHRNPNGVKSISVELCGVDKCPKFRMIEGSCTGDHTYQEYGVCLCEAGYVSKEGTCEACPEGQYSDGRNECTQCGPGEYSIEGRTECGICEGTYSPGGTDKCYECPAHAECSNESFSCMSGFHAIGGSWDTLECVCDDGTILSTGDICIDCPEHATCTDGELECDTGYHKNDTGDGCLPDCTTWLKSGVCQTSCPENATCDGVTFTCNTGYIKSDNGLSCVCPTQQEECKGICYEYCPEGQMRNTATCECNCPEGQVKLTDGSCCPSGLAFNDNTLCCYSINESEECCEAYFPNQNVRYSPTEEICCYSGPFTSEGCCKAYAESDYYHWDATYHRCCRATDGWFGDPLNVCCDPNRADPENQNPECCRGIGGDNSGWDTKNNKCCVGKWLEFEGQGMCCTNDEDTSPECCRAIAGDKAVWDGEKCVYCETGPQTNEACCKMINGSGAKWGNGVCCEYGFTPATEIAMCCEDSVAQSCEEADGREWDDSSCFCKGILYFTEDL